jgi:hypothetical protein
MKQKILILIIILCAFCANSCDFLDKSPDDELTLDMVFGDKTRTEDWLAGVYSAVPLPYLDKVKELDGLADDFSPSKGWETYGWECISKGTGNWSSSSSWGTDYWGNLPKRIRAAYIFIDNVKPNTQQLVTPQEVEYMKAECRFLIAYYYNIMLTNYGAIPLQTTLSEFNASPEELMIGQTPFDEVVDWIDKELVEAAKILPPTYSDAKKYGRATSIMCLAVRARLLLFAASPLVNGNKDYADFVNNNDQQIFNTTYDASKWDKAATAYKELLDLAHAHGHQLYYEYNDDGTIDPFLSYQNLSLSVNKEILFARPSVGGDFNDNGQAYQYDKHASPRGAGGNGGLGVTQELVDAFYMANGQIPILGYKIDGSPIINTASGYTESGFSTDDEIRTTKWHLSKGDASSNTNPVTLAGTYNMYCNREPRFYVSVNYNEAWYWNDGQGRHLNFFMNGTDGGPTHDAPQNGYLVRKKVSPEFVPRDNNKKYRPGILYRLAEAYLGYAEALNESQPAKTTEILLYINKIRERAGIPTYGSGAGQIPAPANQDEMREAIRRERRIELNCEFSIRYDDIRRWKIGEEVCNKMFYGMNYNGTQRADSGADAYYVRTPYLQRLFTSKNYWAPIHQNQIDKNPNLRQLPGY